MSAQTPQVQLTREEVEKRLGKMNIDDEMINLLFHPDASPGQRRQLLQKMLDGAAQYAMNASQVFTDHKFAAHETDYNAIKDMTFKMYRKGMFDGLYGKHPSLKEFSKTVEDAMAAVASGENLPTDENALYDLIANEAESRIKPINPNFSLSPAGAGSTQNNQQNGGSAAVITPANTDAGGFQGGTAGRSPVATPSPGKADAVWED